MTMPEAIAACEADGWILMERTFVDYQGYLAAVRNLEENQFLIDFHVKELMVFPSTSATYWHRNIFVAEHKFILQDKVTLFIHLCKAIFF